MFFDSKREPESQPQVQPQVQPQFQPQVQPQVQLVVPEATRTPQQSPVTHSVIGTELTIIGNLVSDGDIQVDGRVDGDITCRTLTMGVDPVVNASINAETACISGTFNGSIKANRVMLTKDAKMTGDILQQTLEIEKGAILEGTIRRMENGQDQADTAP